MIVEIENPKPSCSSVLDYNEGKVLKGVAQLIGYANMPSVDHDDIYREFERYENNARYGTRQVSFHASVNPSESDTCTEKQVLKFISGMMAHIGMGEQPMLIYRHNDIDRLHYHIVSVRIDKDGRKINNHYEKKAVMAYMRKVCNQYGFSMVERGKKVVKKSSLKNGHRQRRSPHYEPGLPATDQLKEIFTSALEYDFNGEQQLFCILEDLGVSARLSTSDNAPYIVLQGKDKNGDACTDMYSESRLGLPLMEMCMSASVSHKQTHHLRAREKDRVRGLVGAAFSYSKSQKHFERILHNKGIEAHYSRDVNGRLFGLTFVDHTTRSVFKASEIKDVISVSMIQEAIDSGRWYPEKNTSERQPTLAQSRKDAYAEAVALRDRAVGIVARVVKPSRKPKGNSWNGKPKKSDYEKELERDTNLTGRLVISLEDKRFVENIE